MLKNLYRKLHIIFSCSVMVVITAILALIFLNILYSEKNETLQCFWEHLPFFIAIWLVSLIAVILSTGFLLKNTFIIRENELKNHEEFIVMASHELRTPLSVILAYAGTIQSAELPVEVSEKAGEIIDSECKRLSRLVEKMELLISSNLKTWNLHKEQFKMDTLLRNLCEMYEPVCAQKNIKLIIELSDTIYPLLYTNRNGLTQILCIFLDNAIQHNESNTLIEIYAATRNKYVSFSIVDHGKGIDDKEKPYIFNRFYSGDKSHTNKENFGLGLSIAKELIDMLNGRVEVFDTIGGGTTFTITLPLVEVKHMMYWCRFRK